MSEDRQASEGIEVTPEMIKAGASVIFQNPSLCEDGWDELAVEVYEAMESARLDPRRELRARSGACDGDLNVPRVLSQLLESNITSLAHHADTDRAIYELRQGLDRLSEEARAIRRDIEAARVRSA